MSTGVDEQLRNELARIERPLAHAGFLIGEVRVVDEGSWGRLDAVVEGCNIAGKIQIHLGKKGRKSMFLKNENYYKKIRKFWKI